MLYVNNIRSYYNILKWLTANEEPEIPEDGELPDDMPPGEMAPVARKLSSDLGVLEPMQAGPTIIEDNCFIGARSEVVEGCIVREGSVLGMGVFIGKSTKIVDRETGEVMYGEVPPYSVVVAGSMPSKNNVSLYCAVIVKHVDAKTLAKTSLNDLLRNT